MTRKHCDMCDAVIEHSDKLWKKIENVKMIARNVPQEIRMSCNFVYHWQDPDGLELCHDCATKLYYRAFKEND